MIREYVGRLEERVILFERHFPRGVEFAGLTRTSDVPIGFVLSTKRFNDLIDRFRSEDGYYLGELTAIFAVFALVVSYAFVLVGALMFSLMRVKPTKIHNPKNFVLIPGLNDFLPWVAVSYILAAAIVAVFLHELGHAVVAVNNDIPVKRVGIMTLAVLPLGAFVELAHEPDDVDDEYTLLKIAGAGLLVNLVLGLLAAAVYYATPAQLLPRLPPPPRTDSFTAATEHLQTFMETTTSLPPLTQFAFWLGFLNFNFIVLNALPIRSFDGHFTLTSTLALARNRLGYRYDEATVTRYVQYSTLVLLGLMLGGPYLWS